MDTKTVVEVRRIYYHQLYCFRSTQRVWCTFDLWFM